MKPRPPRPSAPCRPAWAGAVLLLLGTRPAAAAPWEGVAPEALALGLGGLCFLSGVLLALFALRRRPPLPGLSAAELEEMRRAVTAFSGTLREGTAVLLQQQRETLAAVDQVAAHSQQLIALIATAEERSANATARAEILATRVARSAAVEVRASVESLTAVSARIEHQARGLEEAIRPVGVRAA
ncbi:hypothetical protein KTR66_00585 [Roseococcus sp. SDR]|uniref:hypothetical protein n=1 Tax=Roseococcus sp. SDR TaxID=2835532 RepID=UPI001BCEA069|nr:hypothetical protein [Roseococcus sp. SDR]MBS7788465.1 hypothetical protein [Roseococcus sp. SDR]MBV1843779.1 hypothetical protein [Roseococcus sp. SDR]